MANSARSVARDIEQTSPPKTRVGKALPSEFDNATISSSSPTRNGRHPLSRTVQFSSAIAEYSASDIKASSLAYSNSPSAIHISSVALISRPLSKQRSKPPLITLSPPAEHSVNLLPSTLAPASSPA